MPLANGDLVSEHKHKPLNQHSHRHAHICAETRAVRNNIRTALESASEHSGLSTPDSTTAAENGKKLAREAVSLEKEFEQLSAEQKSTHKVTASALQTTLN